MRRTEAHQGADDQVSSILSRYEAAEFSQASCGAIGDWRADVPALGQRLR